MGIEYLSKDGCEPYLARCEGLYVLLSCFHDNPVVTHIFADEGLRGYAT